MSASDDEYNPSGEESSAEERSAEERSAEKGGSENNDEEPHGSGEEEADAGEPEAQEEHAPNVYNPNNEIQAEWKYVREVLLLLGKNYKISMAVKEDTFQWLKKRLDSCGQAAVAAFRASAFGVYYQFPDYVVKSARCINYILNREVKGTPDPDPDAMWFQIEDEIVRFSKVEFALVTGLRFGAAQFNPYMEHDIPRTSVYTRRFGNERMTTTALWKKFSDNEWNIGTAEDCVKLCKVMIAAMVVLGNDPSNWKIPDWIWVLVEDAQQWDQFPWGSYSYQQLLTAVRNFNAVEKKPPVRLYANTVAILGWIYSAFPELGINIGGLRADYLDGTPRSLKYFYHRSYTPISITEVHGVLEPTEMEQNTDYYQSLEANGIPFQFTYNHLYEVRRSRSAQTRGRNEVEHSIEAEPSNRHAIDANPHHELSDEAREAAAREEAASRDEAERQAAQKRKRKMEDLSDAIVKKLKESDDFMETLANKIMDKLRGTVSIPPREACLNSQARNEQGNATRRVSTDALEIQQNVEESEQHMIALRESVSIAPIEACLNVETGNEQGNATWRASTDAVEIQQNVDDSEQHMTAQTSRGAARLDQQSSGQIYEPSEPPQIRTAHEDAEDVPVRRTVRKKFPSAVLRSPFRQNEKRGSNFRAFMDRDEDEMRNVGLPIAVGKEYFKTIKDGTAQLENVHMDAYVTVLSKDPKLAKLRMAENGRTIPISLTFMQAVGEIWRKMHGQEPVKSKIGTNTEEVLQKDDFEMLERFAEGLQPEWGGLRKWIEADKLLLLCHMEEQEHWVVIEAELAKCTLILWDPNEPKHDARLKKLRRNTFRPLGRILPQLLKGIDYYNYNPGTPDFSPNFTEWNLEFPRKGVNKLLQNDSVSCGPLCLRIMERRLTNASLTALAQDELLEYRSHIAETIFNYSTDENTISI